MIQFINESSEYNIISYIDTIQSWENI